MVLNRFQQWCRISKARSPPGPFWSLDWTTWSQLQTVTPHSSLGTDFILSIQLLICVILFVCLLLTSAVKSRNIHTVDYSYYYTTTLVIRVQPLKAVFCCGFATSNQDFDAVNVDILIQQIGAYEPMVILYINTSHLLLKLVAMNTALSLSDRIKPEKIIVRIKYTMASKESVVVDKHGRRRAADFVSSVVTMVNQVYKPQFHTFVNFMITFTGQIRLFFST